MSKKCTEDYERLVLWVGTSNKVLCLQGDRLLVSGDWLGIEKRIFKRLKNSDINFPNANDFDWNLDIKKSTQCLLLRLERNYQNSKIPAVMKSAKVQLERRKTISNENGNASFESLWKDETNREKELKI
jgi:hypothetical protein